MLRKVLLAAMAISVSFALTAISGYILYKSADTQSEIDLSLIVRFISNPVIAASVGALVGLFSKDNPGLTSIIGLTPWAVMSFGLGPRPATGNFFWVGLPVVVYIALGAGAAQFVWWIRHKGARC